MAIKVDLQNPATKVLGKQQGKNKESQTFLVNSRKPDEATILPVFFTINRINVALFFLLTFTSKEGP